MLYKIAGIWRHTKDGQDTKVYYKGKIDTPFPIILEPGMELLLFKSRLDSPNAPAFDLMVDKPRPPAGENPDENNDF